MLTTAATGHRIKHRHDPARGKSPHDPHNRRGQLAYEKRFFQTPLDAFGFQDGFALWGFFENGSYTGTKSNRDEEGPYMAEEWELPEGFLPIALVDGSASCFVTLNRDRAEFPPNSVLFVDAEIEDIVCLADDFESFVSQLRKSPYV